MSQLNFPAIFFNSPSPALNIQQRPTTIPPSVAALFTSPAASVSLTAANRTPPTDPIAIVKQQPTTPKSSRSAGDQRDFHSTASMPLLGDRPLVPFYATAPRLGPQFLLRRQHSSSTAAMCGQGKGRYAGAVGKNGRYTTPPPMRYSGCGVVHKGSDEEEVPTRHFAASKFSDSPSAKSLPPPPSAWMEEIEKRMVERKLLTDEKRETKTKKVGMDGIEEEEATSDDTGVVFDLEDISPTGSFDNENNNASNTASSGVRVDPMKLIAAASLI